MPHLMLHVLNEERPKQTRNKASVNSVRLKLASQSIATLEIPVSEKLNRKWSQREAEAITVGLTQEACR